MSSRATQPQQMYISHNSTTEVICEVAIEVECFQINGRSYIESLVVIHCVATLRGTHSKSYLAPKIIVRIERHNQRSSVTPLYDYIH